MMAGLFYALCLSSACPSGRHRKNSPMNSARARGGASSRGSCPEEGLKKWAFFIGGGSWRTLVAISVLLFLGCSSVLVEAFQESSLQVWAVRDRRWGVAEELAYAKWVEENLTEDFFIRHKIPVDCADVPYAVRWIYSRVAHLPAAATTKNGKLIGHWSTQWGHLPTHPQWYRDPRFRAALRHMLSETTTRTLPFDTYPIRIGRDSVTPGTAFYVMESHSGIVGHLVLDGSAAHPVQTWEASVPAKLQKLSMRNFLSPRPESISQSGLVKFRWPILENGRWGYLPKEAHPYYSEEQYRSIFYEGCRDFVEAVARRVDPTTYDPMDKAEKLIETITRFLQDRIPIVLEGNQRCLKGRCPEGSMPWELYSTPGRDGMIVLLMDHLHHLVESNHLDQEFLRKKMERILLPISKDRSITFYYVYENYLWLSPHPEDPIEARWGLQKCEMIRSRMKATRSSIAFIGRHYRKRDPQYAAFALRQQEEILKQLEEEWEKSQCGTLSAGKGRHGAQKK